MSTAPAPTTPSTTGQLAAAGPAVPAAPRTHPADRHPLRRVVAHGPEVAALIAQVEQMAERVSHVAEDVGAEIGMVAASPASLRGVLRDLAAAELSIRKGAERCGLTVTVDLTAAGVAAKPPAVAAAGSPEA